MAAGKHRLQPARRHAVAKAVLASVLVLAIGTGTAVALAYRHLDGNVRHHDYSSQLTNRPEPVVATGPQRPVNILVMGSDTRAGKGNRIDGMLKMGTHSDTTILFHLSADRTFAYGISIPRDSIVARPDCQEEDGTVVAGYQAAMWNEAFNKAGPACTIQQFEQLTGVRVDHSVVVDFAGFRDMVDAIDGVDVCLPAPVEDSEYGITLPAGSYTVTGDQALSYVRERHGVGDGSDIGRMKRQQAFLASMVNKVVSAGTLTNPVRLYKFLNAATKSLDVDQEMGNLKDMAALGYQFRDIGLAKVRFVTLPWESYALDANRVQWKQPDADALWRLVKADKPLPRRLSAISADGTPGKHQGGTGGQSGTEDPASVGLCG